MFRNRPGKFSVLQHRDEFAPVFFKMRKQRFQRHVRRNLIGIFAHQQIGKYPSGKQRGLLHPHQAQKVFFLVEHREHVRYRPVARHHIVVLLQRAHPDHVLAKAIFDL